VARAWIEDRAEHAEYIAALAAAKAAGRKCRMGRWRVRWFDPGGAERAKSFERKPDAERHRNEVETRLGDGSYRDPAAGKVKFEEVAESWIAAQAHLKRSSRNRYREVLDVYVLPQWGGHAVNRIDFEDIAAWIGTVIKEPGAKGRPLGTSQVRAVHRVMHMALGWAVKSKRIAVNPATGVPLPRIAPSDHIYLDHVQVEQLAAAAGEYRVVILFLAYTGLRFGEASALRVGRVNLEARRARVVEAYGDDDGELYLDTPKDHEVRSVGLPPFLAIELKPFVYGRDPDELLFTAPRGGPLRAHNFRSRVFAPTVKDAKLDALNLTPHKLRHTAASLSIASGADVKVVQTMLGHKTATMTLDTYGHLWPDRLDEVSDRLDTKRAEALARADTKKGHR
jgi:integrase